MSRNRYLDIMRSLHFSDNNLAPTPRDRLYKLGDFLPSLLNNFEKAINCSEFICIDESLMPFKGRLSFKQYNAKKRARFGIKLFAVVDNETKFISKLSIYLGKHSTISPSIDIKRFGYGGSTIITLLQNYMNKNHRVVIDNWFNSPELQMYLKYQNTYVLGTVKKNRKLMPTFNKKIAKGTCEAYHCNGMLLERWMDRREVFMLNTFINHEMKDSISTNPLNTRKKPKSVLEYNSKMGGVDHIDKQIAPYKMLRKTKKWYKKVAFHLIELTIHNSYVVYNHYHQSSKLSYYDFLLLLTEEILEKHKLQRKLKRKSSGLAHLPTKNLKTNGKPQNSDCHLCNKLGIRKATPFSCKGCGKRLCIDGPESCFSLFHEKSISEIRKIRPTPRDTLPSQVTTSAPDPFKSYGKRVRPESSQTSLFTTSTPRAPSFSPVTDYEYVLSTGESSIGTILPNSNPSL